jgi:hypothetical protein
MLNVPVGSRVPVVIPMELMAVMVAAKNVAH